MDDLAGQLAALRPALMRMAQQRVRNPAWSEDAVSETLLAALDNPVAYQGRAQLQTWLIGILKHKLMDQIRRGTREQGLAGDDDSAFATGDCTAPLWAAEAGASWGGDPQDGVVRRQFMRQLERSIETLPVKQGQAFVLRECLEVDAPEVCRELGVTPNNLAVLLHRARHRLRKALQAHWLRDAKDAHSGAHA